MKIRKVKKYIGLCQCKGCLHQCTTIITFKNSDNKLYLCDVHAFDAFIDPFITLGRF